MDIIWSSTTIGWATTAEQGAASNSTPRRVSGFGYGPPAPAADKRSPPESLGKPRAEPAKVMSKSGERTEATADSMVSIAYHLALGCNQPSINLRLGGTGSPIIGSARAVKQDMHAYLLQSHHRRLKRSNPTRQKTLIVKHFTQQNRALKVTLPNPDIPCSTPISTLTALGT